MQIQYFGGPGQRFGTLIWSTHADVLLAWQFYHKKEFVGQMSRRVISWNKFTCCPSTLRRVYNILNYQYQKYLPLKCSKPCKNRSHGSIYGCFVDVASYSAFQGPHVSGKKKMWGLHPFFPLFSFLLFLLFFNEPRKSSSPGGVRSSLLCSSSGHLHRCCPLLRLLPAPPRLPALPAAAPPSFYPLCRPLARVIPPVAG